MPVDPTYRAAAEQAYRALNDSPMQRKLREKADTLVGAVYWNPQEDTAEQIRYELTRLRETGFTFVRFHATEPRELGIGEYDFTYPDLRMDLAHEVGLKIYPHFGWNRLSPAALQAEGLSQDEAQTLGIQDERVERVIRSYVRAIVEHYRDHPAIIAWPTMGEPHGTGIPLVTDRCKDRFLVWLKEHYPDPQAIHDAWLIYPDVRRDFFNEDGKKILCIDDWQDAVDLAASIDMGTGGFTLATTGMSKHERYGAFRDLVRFRSDQMVANIRKLVDIIREYDDTRPICVGNHQFFYSNGQLGWNMAEFARQGDMAFSSIHLSWHFESVAGEVDKPHYLQARMTNDFFKGGYTNAYETTGGPVQYSGGYGNHMDAGLMRKMMLNYLAAGNEGIAFWAWKARPGGVEAGEYGLVGLSGRITEWAEESGKVIAAMERHRHEIWHSSNGTEVALLRSWNTETTMCCEPRRYACEDGPSPWSRGPAQQHIRALIGASRAAIDAQVAFEYITEEEIGAGIAGVYPTIYLPHVRCCTNELLEKLQEYVEAGGRLVADVQIGFEDQWGKVRHPGKGGLVERLFGAWIDAIGDTNSRPVAVDGVPVKGFFGDIVTTTATVIRRFDTGKPAVTETRIGQGTAVLVAFDAARQCWQPGDTGMERILGDLLRGSTPRRFSCDVPMTFRRECAAADHYYISNDGPARSAVLRVFDRSYTKVEDVLEAAEIEVVDGIPVEVEAYGGLWLRCEK